MKAHTPNSTFTIGGVPCSADKFVVTESSVHRINFCTESPSIANLHTATSNRKKQQLNNHL